MVRRSAHNAGDHGFESRLGLLLFFVIRQSYTHKFHFQTWIYFKLNLFTLGNLINATAAERAKRALAGGSGAEPQVRVRVSVFG